MSLYSSSVDSSSMADPVPDASPTANVPTVTALVPYSTTVSESVPRWQLARCKNKNDCQLFRLPPELLLLVCSFIDPASRHALRQACSQWMHIVTRSDLHPRAVADLCEHWKRHHQDVFGGTTPLPFYDAQCTMATHGVCPLPPARPKSYLDHLYCADCRLLHDNGHFHAILARLQQPLFCDRCDRYHPTFLFSRAQRDAATHMCLAWEAELRICPHSYASREDAQDIHESWICFQHGFGPNSGICTQCTVEYQMSYDPATRSVEFTLPVCHLEADEPVTIDRLRRAWEDRKALYWDFLCTHVTTSQLLLVFEPDQCACFPAPEPPAEGLHVHGDDAPCCRCRAQEQPQLAGQLLPSWPEDTSTAAATLHKFTCNKCSATYAWSRSGSLVRVDVRRKIYGRDRKWLNAIDGATWNARRDGSVRGIQWCETHFCRTNTSWPAQAEEDRLGVRLPSRTLPVWEDDWEAATAAIGPVSTEAEWADMSTVARMCWKEAWMAGAQSLDRRGRGFGSAMQMSQWLEERMVLWLIGWNEGWRNGDDGRTPRSMVVRVMASKAAAMERATERAAQHPDDITGTGIVARRAGRQAVWTEFWQRVWSRTWRYGREVGKTVR